MTQASRGANVAEVGLASIGLGWWGKVLAEAVGKTGEASVVSCFARGEEGRLAFAEQFGCGAASSIDEVLSDPAVDGVIIATSHLSHRDLIEQAASAGKAVFVDKPLTTTTEDAKAAIAAVEKAGVVLQVGHQRRRTAANRRIHQMLESGEIGDIQAMEANQSVPNGFTWPADAWRRNAEEAPLGGMTSLGIHKIDSMQYHAGPIKSVFCYTRPGRKVSVDESTVVALEFESGALGTLITSFFTPVISELAVFGTEAAAYNEADGARLFVQQRGEMNREEVELTPVDPVVDQLVEFARSIRGETAPETGGRVALEVVATLEAAVESSRTGRSVDLSDYR
jgi:predicted dehydrogenase